MKVVLDEGAFLPEYAHEEDAGMDLRSPVNVTISGRKAHDSGADLLIGGGVFGRDYPVDASCAIIDTGVHVQIPKGHVGFFKSKSGLNVKNHLTSEGVIDEGYTGPLVVKLYNHGSEPYKINRGDKITQLVILPVNHVSIEQVDSLDNTTRGDNGFGSTGR